jgi:hypothetical protein
VTLELAAAAPRIAVSRTSRSHQPAATGVTGKGAGCGLCPSRAMPDLFHTLGNNGTTERSVTQSLGSARGVAGGRARCAAVRFG